MENKYVQIEIDSDLKRKVKIKCAMSGDTLKTVITALLTGWVKGEIILSEVRQEM